VEPLRHGQWLG